MIYGEEEGTSIDPTMKPRSILVRPIDKYGPICVGDEVVIGRMYFDSDLVLVVEVVKRPEPAPKPNRCESRGGAQDGWQCTRPVGHDGRHSNEYDRVVWDDQYTRPASVTFPQDCDEPCNEWGEPCRLPEGHHGEHDPRDPQSVQWRAPEPEEFCGAAVGTKPSWMSVDQYDPCRCIRPKGHQGKHQCSHTIEEKSQ